MELVMSSGSWLKRKNSNPSQHCENAVNFDSFSTILDAFIAKGIKSFNILKYMKSQSSAVHRLRLTLITNINMCWQVSAGAREGKCDEKEEVLLKKKNFDRF